MHTAHRFLVVGLSAVLTLGASLSCASAAEFHGLGTPELFVRNVEGVSADGGIAVGTRWHPGQDADHAVMWKDGKVTDLGTLGGRRSWARKITPDGSMIVGGSDDSSGNTLALYWRAGAMTAIQVQPGLPERRGGASGVSADGSVIVGSASFRSVENAFRWVGKPDGNGVMTSLGVSDGVSSAAFDTSADGSVVVGIIEYAPKRPIPTLGFRWVNGPRGGTMTLLRSGGAVTVPMAVSADGAVIVGARDNEEGQREAFRWERGTMTGLGALRHNFLHSQAMGVNGNGSVIVGDAESTGGTEAFRWTQADGMKSIRQLLEAAGVRFDGWYLMKAMAVSHDGRVIFGVGRNPAGKEQAWRAVIDLPPGRSERSP